MPQKKFKFLNSDMLSSVDSVSEIILGSSAAETSKTQFKNTIKKVFDELGRDPRIPMGENDDELSAIVSSAITKINQPSEATLKQTGRKVVDYIKKIIEIEAEANKTEEEKAFEAYVKSEEAKRKFIEEYGSRKREILSEPDFTDEDGESEEETKEILEQQKKKRRKT
jgi:vacuolar-type H+-ATPase subunit I/STV1